MVRRAIRIGNCSGAIGDGLDQLYRQAAGGPIDGITADYLAEFNLAWKAIEVSPYFGIGILHSLSNSNL
jgi:Acyclic terpene utilisation family protein AtuA